MQIQHAGSAVEDDGVGLWPVGLAGLGAVLGFVGLVFWMLGRGGSWLLLGGRRLRNGGCLRARMTLGGGLGGAVHWRPQALGCGGA